MPFYFRLYDAVESGSYEKWILDMTEYSGSLFASKDFIDRSTNYDDMLYKVKLRPAIGPAYIGALLSIVVLLIELLSVHSLSFCKFTYNSKKIFVLKNMSKTGKIKPFLRPRRQWRDKKILNFILSDK